MSKQIAAVVFEDASRLYLIYDPIADTALRPLFPTELAARNWLERGMPKISAPNDAENSEQQVTIFTDLSLDPGSAPGQALSFPSRASKPSLWLTGPRSFLELMYENGATASRTE